MKLAEALIIRSDFQVRVEKIRERLLNNVRIQEGEKASEDPVALLSEFNSVMDDLTELIQRINRTNSKTIFKEGFTIADALAKKDNLTKKRQLLELIVGEASSRYIRQSKSEVKFISTIDVEELQKEIDMLSKEFRLLDTALQEKNWTIELI